MWRDGASVLAQVVSGPTGWIDSSDPRLAPNQGATVVCGTTEGAAAVAVRLWREILFERLHVRQELRPARPLMLREARFQVQAHAQSTHDAYADLLTAVAPQQALNQLDTAIGPTGMTGVVYPDINEGPQVTWLIDYGRTDGVAEVVKQVEAIGS